MTPDPRPTPSGADPLADLFAGLAATGDARDEGDTTPGPGGRHRGRVPLLTVPRSLRSVDIGTGIRAARGLIAVGLVVVLVLGGRWAWAVRSAAPEPVDVVTPSSSTERGAEAAVPPSSAPDSFTATTTTAPSTSEPPAPVHLLVHVAGQVGAPGVVTVPEGARVIDAVKAAGGFTPEADQTGLNLARLVVDGEQVWVGRPGETPPAPVGTPPVPGTPGTASGPGAGRGAPGSGTLLDLNTAGQADLETLPGIGPVTAGQILAWRDAHGRFTRVDELLEVSGIGERTLARLEPLVTVGG